LQAALAQDGETACVGDLTPSYRGGKLALGLAFCRPYQQAFAALLPRYQRYTLLRLCFCCRTAALAHRLAALRHGILPWLFT